MRKSEKNSVAIFLAAALLTGLLAASAPSIVDTEATEDKRDDYKRDDNKRDDYKQHDEYEEKKDYGNEDKNRYEEKKDYGYEEKKDYVNEDKNRYEEKKDYGYEEKKDYGYPEEKKDYGYEEKKDYGYPEEKKDYGYPEEKKYGHDDKYGYEKEKDYSYDKMSYKHDDQKYGYQNDYKKDSKTIKCTNYNFDGRSSHGSNGGGPGSGMSAFAQGDSSFQDSLGGNPYGAMGGQMGGHDGPRGGFEKHTDKDVVVYCIFKNDKRPQVDTCGEEVKDCFADSLSATEFTTLTDELKTGITVNIGLETLTFKSFEDICEELGDRSQTEVAFIISELLTNAGLSIHPDTVLVIVNCILEALDKPIIVIP